MNCAASTVGISIYCTVSVRRVTELHRMWQLQFCLIDLRVRCMFYLQHHNGQLFKLYFTPQFKLTYYIVYSGVDVG